MNRLTSRHVFDTAAMGVQFGFGSEPEGWWQPAPASFLALRQALAAFRKLVPLARSAVGAVPK